MKKALIVAMAAATALSGVAGGASAQPGDWRDRDHHVRDRDRDGVPDRVERWDRRHWDRDRDRWAHGGYRSYGGRYGYHGYQGRWRSGQRYSHWRDHRYVIEDWRAYRLPPPPAGYRYYRDDSGDIVMVAIASGVIGMILGSALTN